MFRNISIIIELPSTPELFLYNKALNQLISVHVYAHVCAHIEENKKFTFSSSDFPAYSSIPTIAHPPNSLLIYILMVQ